MTEILWLVTTVSLTRYKNYSRLLLMLKRKNNPCLCTGSCVTSTAAEKDRNMFEVNLCLYVCPCSDLICAKRQTVGLLASKQRAISFWGLNQNHCLSQYPAVLVRQLSHGFSLLLQFVADNVWLFKNSLFFQFWGKVWAPFRKPLRWSNLNSMYRGVFFKGLFSGFPSLSLSHHIPLSVNEGVDWTRNEGVGLWCVPCSHK